jgi:adenylate cyclase
VLTAWVVAALGVVAWIVHDRRTRRGLENRLAAASQELESLQRAFARFAPAEVVEDIIARGASRCSEKKDVTVLFADLKGFTTLAEEIDPQVLVRILNGYFERMSRALRAHQGHVSEFIGDGILALFGALEANPWQTNDATHAALAMHAALAEYNETLRAEGLPTLAMGIGIHRGMVVAGVFGNADLMKYGVIGSTVNLASRVQGLTRVHGAAVLVTEATRAALDPGFRLRPMPATEVKGFVGALPTFAVDGFET